MRKFLNILIWPIVATCAIMVWVLTETCGFLVRTINKITKE